MGLIAKKYFKRIVLISVVILITTLLSLNFIVEHSIKSVLNDVVRRETSGLYQLNFSKISVNIIRGIVTVRSADFKPADTSQYQANYRLKIDGLYFSLGSWKQLLFHRTLLVDSIQINHPEISMFHPVSNRNSNPLLQMQAIYASMKKISEKFKVHVLEITNGDISIYNQGANDRPLLIRSINFRVENFGEKTNEKTKLRLSDEFVLNITRQHWLFPSGKSLDFKRLYFSGKDQFFQLDSCLLINAAGNSGQGSSLYADKLLFRANNLYSIFERNELNIDTLYCKSPVLSFNLAGSKVATDSAGGLHQLLGNIYIGYTNIENGEIRINSPDSKRSYASQKTDVKIYALDISKDHLPHIRAGDVKLNLNEITFTSRDSQYLLTIKKFELDGDNLICKNAFLKPASGNKSSLSIRLPAFTLVDVSLQDLLEKRLKARYLRIDEPEIYFKAGEKKTKAVGRVAVMDRLFDVLNGLTQLIDVSRLTVKNGKVEYYPAAAHAFKLVIKDINTEIDLNELLKSSSLIDTKLSIRSLEIGSFHLYGGKTSLEVKNIFANGSRQMGKLGSVHLGLPSGLQLNAANIYWSRFSWDDFLKGRKIVIDSLDIDKLYFTAGSRGHKKENNKEIMPQVAIKRLNIREAFINVSKRENKTELTAKAKDVLVGQLTLADSLFSWSELTAKMEDISFRDEIRKVTVQQLRLSANNESQAENIVYNDSKNFVRIPQIKFQLNINGSGLNDWQVPFLSLYRPEIVIGSPAAGSVVSKKHSHAGVMSFQVQNLDIIDGKLHYGFAGKQSFESPHFWVQIKSAGKDKIDGGAISFDQAAMNFDSVSFHTENNSPVTLNKLDLDIRKGSLRLTDEHKPSFTGLLNGQWKSLTLNKPTKNGHIEIRDLSGRVEELSLSLPAGSRNQFIEDVINSVNLTKGRFVYTDSSVTATISNLSGSGKEGLLELKDVEVKPKETLESFYKTSKWQKDYITFQCERIVINKINSRALLQDTALAIQHIYLQNPRLSAYRDKNIPFQHDIEKLMPSKLISKIRSPLRVDSVFISGAAINVHEISAITKMEGVVPLRNIEALLKNLTNRPDKTDSLQIDVHARVLDYDIKKFSYKESYHDSLSGFNINYGISPMSLPALTEVTGPLSAVAVTSGHADTLFAKLSGNKYAAFGDMNFYYRDLRIRLLNKDDTLKKSFSLALESLLANSLIIKSKNTRESRIFYVRDREKFVFNYWVKTLFSGLLTSAGVKRNAQYQKMQDRFAEKYSLPAANVLPR